MMNKSTKRSFIRRAPDLTLCWPIDEQPVVRSIGLFENVNHPVVEKIARRGFYIPSGLALNCEQIDIVNRSVRAVLE